MTVDRYGSCQCDEGYWLTDQGCKKCEELIPGCDECYRTSTNTLIPLYTGATLSNFVRSYYVDCRKCGYHNFRTRVNLANDEPPACPHCDTKWEGCGYCGAYGYRCSRCLPSHVFQQWQYDDPCLPCTYYHRNCAWCRGASECIKTFGD